MYSATRWDSQRGSRPAGYSRAPEFHGAAARALQLGAGAAALALILAAWVIALRHPTAPL